jgi:hypothetical protein
METILEVMQKGLMYESFSKVEFFMRVSDPALMMLRFLDRLYADGISKCPSYSTTLCTFSLMLVLEWPCSVLV